MALAPTFHRTCPTGGYVHSPDMMLPLLGPSVPGGPSPGPRIVSDRSAAYGWTLSAGGGIRFQSWSDTIRNGWSRHLNRLFAECWNPVVNDSNQLAQPSRRVDED